MRYEVDLSEKKEIQLKPMTILRNALKIRRHECDDRPCFDIVNLVFNAAKRL